jgi:hypothetical protein
VISTEGANQRSEQQAHHQGERKRYEYVATQVQQRQYDREGDDPGGALTGIRHHGLRSDHPGGIRLIVPHF